MKKHARGGTPIECPQCRGPFLASGLPKYRDGLMRNKNLEQLDKDVDELTRTNSSTALDICTIHLQCTQEPLGIFLYKFMCLQTHYGWKRKLQGNLFPNFESRRHNFICYLLCPNKSSAPINTAYNPLKYAQVATNAT